MSKTLYFLIFLLASSSLVAQNVNQKAYERYINTDLYNQMVQGFYIQGNKKVEAKIKYVPPIDMQDPSNYIILDRGKGEEVVPKSKVNAIGIDNHIFIPEDLGDSVVWVMLEQEGALRETIFFNPIPPGNPTYYKVSHLITNTTTHEGHFVGSLAINFNKVMAGLTSENVEITEKIANREQGYRFIDYKKIIAEYNLWILNTYPKRIKYIGEVPDYQAVIDNDLSKYMPKN